MTAVGSYDLFIIAHFKGEIEGNAVAEARHRCVWLRLAEAQSQNKP